MGQIERRTTYNCVIDRCGGDRLCFVCQVRTETLEAVVNGNTQSSMMDCNLLGSDVPTFTRNGLSTVNQVQECGEIVLCVL